MGSSRIPLSDFFYNTDHSPSLITHDTILSIDEFQQQKFCFRRSSLQETYQKGRCLLRRIDEALRLTDETLCCTDETLCRTDETLRRTDETLRRIDETLRRSDETYWSIRCIFS